MKQRSQVLASLAERKFDLVVIGCGLLGAGIALEAASHGFSVLVADKGDFASGSSSRTSKLAGTANLLTGTQFSLTDWKSKTNQISQLYRRAPHMVKDFVFVMPITPDRFLFSLKAQLMLALQDVQANVLGASRGHKRHNKQGTMRIAPALAPQSLVGGLSFHDCIVDDSRFVLELVKSAQTKGALALNYLEAKQFTIENGEVQSIVLRDRLEGQEITVLPKAVVSACGVWTDTLAKLIDPEARHSIKTVRSTFITLPQSVMETGDALFLPASDNGYVFVVPWQRVLLVGTTATAYEGDPEDTLPTSNEISYLLDTINRYKRGDRAVTGADVACAWAGLNIIPCENNDTPSLFRGPAGVITGFGGHLTDFQKMADLAVHLVTKKIGPGANNADSGEAQKAGGQSMLGGFADKEDYLLTTAEISARSRKLGLEPAGLDHLLSTYGKDAMLILDMIEQNPALSEKICPDFPPLMAEIVHCVENEMALSLEDVLCRRIRLGFLHREQCLAAAPKVAKMMQELCGWDLNRFKSELSSLARNLASQLAPVS